MFTGTLMLARRLFVSLSFLLPCLVVVEASADVAPEVNSVVAQPGELGSGAFRWFGFKIYEAQLFTTQGKRFQWEKPFALQLKYARKVRARIQLRASQDELERLEGSRPDHPQIVKKLTGCLRDVKSGDRVVAAARGADELDFFVNGTQTCSLTHTGIRDRYMSIWLSDQARDRELARRLRGAV